MIGIIFVVGFLVFSGLVYIGISHTIAKEKERYNNGICPKCNSKLQYVETDMDNEERLYVCSKCNDYHTWVSYDCVDKK